MFDSSEHRRQTTLSDLFEQEELAAFVFGMSYEEYWGGELEYFWAYAYRYKQMLEKERQEQDTLAWLIGQYVLQAVHINFASAFGKRGAPKPKYPEMPVYVGEHNESAKAKREERETMRSYNNFIAAAQRMGKLQT